MEDKEFIRANITFSFDNIISIKDDKKSLTYDYLQELKSIYNNCGVLDTPFEEECFVPVRFSSLKDDVDWFTNGITNYSSLEGWKPTIKTLPFSLFLKYKKGDTFTITIPICPLSDNKHNQCELIKVACIVRSPILLKTNEQIRANLYINQNDYIDISEELSTTPPKYLTKLKILHTILETNTKIKYILQPFESERFVQVTYKTRGIEDSDWFKHGIDNYTELTGWRPVIDMLPSSILDHYNNGDVVTLTVPLCNDNQEISPVMAKAALIIQKNKELSHAAI